MKKTLLVLGAGSSKSLYDYFPTGLELIREINKLLSLDIDLLHDEPNSSNGRFLSTMMNAALEWFKDDLNIKSEIAKIKHSDLILSEGYRKLSVLRNELWKVQLDYESRYYRGQFDRLLSIDYFVTDELETFYKKNSNASLEEVDHQREFEKKMIKSSIYHIIKGAENAFIEYHYGQCGQIETSDCRRENWIKDFVEQLQRADIEELGSKLWILDFNYDRVFEYVFITELKKRFGFWVEDYIQKKFNQNNIVHAYGSIGTLADLPIFVDNHKREPMEAALRKFDLIRSGSSYGKVPEYSVAQVAFIGFGYGKENMELVLEKLNGTPYLVGTAIGQSAKSKEIIEKDHQVKLCLTLRELIDCCFSPC